MVALVGHEGRKVGGLTRRAALASRNTAIAGAANARTFDEFIAQIRATARAHGVAGTTVDRALAGVKPDARVVELDRRQAAGGVSFATYRRRVLSSTRVGDGRERFAAHGPLLQSISDAFGVSPRIIVALWGIESSYGRVTGGFPVIRSLATLAYDGRRETLFTGELLAALRILDQTPLDAGDMLGSWAGAMGQAQFLPSTYLNHAVDYDGDGWADIWSSRQDVFASMANYLRAIGWRPGWRWGREVSHRDGFAGLSEGAEGRRHLTAWAEAGVRRADGGPLPVADGEAWLVMPDGRAGATFLVYDNFDVLRTWNRSTYFALSVGLLGDSF